MNMIPEWFELADCAKPYVDRDLWYSEKPSERKEAVEICKQCPVHELCEEYGSDEKWGIWGGKDRGSDFERARREQAKRAKENQRRANYSARVRDAHRRAQAGDTDPETLHLAAVYERRLERNRQYHRSAAS